MRIELRCFATLREYCPPDGEVNIPEGSDLRRLLEELAVPADEVKLMFINGKRADPGVRLQEGDRVGLFPPVGGG